MTTDWPTKITRSNMEDYLARDLTAVMRGNHGDWRTTGGDHAALALREAMSDVSEQCWCAAWLIDLGTALWPWLQGRTILKPWGDPERSMDTERRRIIALASVAGVWWADYDYAVPISDWIARHGEAQGVELIA